MIPIMEREFVDKNRWMDKQEFMDIMVVAQTTPGIFAIDMASHIGYKMKGVWGGIVGAVGIALPSIIAILIIAMFFQQFKDNYWVGKFFAGVRPAVVALIAAPCFKMAKTANINRYNIWIPFVCCALIAAFGISPIYIRGDTESCNQQTADNGNPDVVAVDVCRLCHLEARRSNERYHGRAHTHEELAHPIIVLEMLEEHGDDENGDDRR